MPCIWYLCLVGIFLDLSSPITPEPQHLATVAQGVLRGKSMNSRTGRPFAAFLKVPYAAPPLGQLRFKAPQDPIPWEGVRDATQDAALCSQRNIFIKKRFFFNGQEDCLYLNVFTPQVDSIEGLPVMVWFHGGGFVTGSGNTKYYPPEYLMDKDIVLVTLNYRLGPMGFLSMEDDLLPGNWGLKDQTKALQWVQNNIAQFGGDPGSITLFGESAGGASVHYHMMSPLSKGLFHRGISQSGTPFCAWAIAQPGVTRNNTIKIGQLLDCPTHSTQALVSCMRDKPVQDIILQDIHFMEWFTDPMTPFKPVVEKQARVGEAFLPDHPEVIVREGRVADVPWMTGLNSGDGALKVAALYDDYKLVEELERNFADIVPMSLFYKNHHDQSSITEKLRKFYLGEHSVDNTTHRQVVDIWTDGWFLSGAEQSVRLMAGVNKSPIYYYYFAYRGTASFSAVFGDRTRDYGTCHADELIYLFPLDDFFPGILRTQEDKKYMELLLDMWTDFAKTGNPTPGPGGVKWQPISSDNHEYLHLGPPEDITMSANLLHDRTKFWTDLLQDIKHHPSREEL